MGQIIGNLIERLEIVDSTNNYANRQVRANEVNEGTVFLAYEQTMGRGQQSNTWESEHGLNLLFSIVLKPVFLEIKDQYLLSKVVALGVYRALSKFVGALCVKWPNDIYAGNKKLGGILIENSIMNGVIMNSVVGVGINVNQTVFKSNAPNPVSLKMLTNQHYDCEQLLSEILLEIERYYLLLQKGQREIINSDFESVLFRLKEKHYYKADDVIFEGEICGVNEIGQLVIRTNNGQLQEFHFKEVEFIFR